jgi:acyl-coenzyme A synthetase/AMP-(fatty) acid ligase
LHAACYAGWDATTRGPPPLWTPTPASAAATNLARFMATMDGGPAWRAAATGDPIKDLPTLHRLSWADPDAWWPAVLPHLGVRFDVAPRCVLERGPADDPDKAVWFPGAKLNIAASALYGRDDDAPALVCADEGAPTRVATLRLGELRAAAATAGAAFRTALGLRPGDAVAVIGTLNATTVALYLGAILVGAVPVSIAESFAAPEIATRLRLAAVRAVVVADVVRRGGKELPLYPRVADAVEAAMAGGLAPPAVRVFAAAAASPPSLPLRPGAVPWADTLAALPPGAGAALVPASLAPSALAGLLFSSGTTGDPKCIPWTHTTPIRCALDCWANLDVRPRDVLAWPTSLGWMMGPFSIFGALLPGACLALFDGSPLGPPFAAFVAAARVTMLGVVPSMVRTWRAGDALRDADWGALRCFGSTGEASSPDDYAWLASAARYVPALEVCGGTELGGGFASGTLLSPWAPSTFSTPAFGAQFVLLTPDGRQSAHGEDGAPAAGEVALVPPAVGMSQTLVGRDHAAAYYAGMPLLASASTPPTRLRRHGDEFARLPGWGGACYAALGRVDDTMNVGGVKVASAEIERAVMGSGSAFAASVAEVAAVGVPAPGGGPEALTLVAVANPGAGPPPDPSALRAAATAALRSSLNPLFRVERVVVVRDLPRTATGKVMRRELRADLARGAKL